MLKRNLNNEYIANEAPPLNAVTGPFIIREWSERWSW